MPQPSGNWRFASGFWRWIRPFPASVRKSGTGAAQRCSRASLARRSSVFRRSTSPRTLSLFRPGRTRRASCWPTIRLAGRTTMPPRPIFRGGRAMVGQPETVRAPSGSIRQWITCSAAARRKSDRLSGMAAVIESQPRKNAGLHIPPSFAVERGAPHAYPSVVATQLPHLKIHRARAFMPSSSSSLTSEGTPRMLEVIGATVAVDK